jgi:hypothetical protein
MLRYLGREQCHDLGQDVQVPGRGTLSATPAEGHLTCLRIPSGTYLGRNMVRYLTLSRDVLHLARNIVRYLGWDMLRSLARDIFSSLSSSMFICLRSKKNQPGKFSGIRQIPVLGTLCNASRCL